MSKVLQVREILSSLLKVKATKIELSAEPISPLFIPQNNQGHSWWHGAGEHQDKLGLFSFAKGLVWCEDIKREYSFSRNGDQEHEAGETIADYFDRTMKTGFDFAIIKYVGKDYGEQGQRYEGVTILKLPDFAAHWEVVENADLARWQEWLG